MTAAREWSAAELPRLWRAGSREILLDHPIVMGILNVTPDSFSDGGNFLSLGAAIEHAAGMVADGADIVDVGGESTRPGALPVAADEEAARVVPVVQALHERWPDLAISIDTTKAAVASAALEAGAEIVNDVSAMRLDPAMPSVVAKARCGLILMHSRGTVQDMATYEHALYGDVTSEVIAELGSQLLLAEEAGVERESVVLDPGFGFSKRSEHSMTLLHELGRLAAMDVPLAVGVSRKRFVRETLKHGEERAGGLTLEETDAGSAAVNVLALERGATVFRVHNVKVNRAALDAAWTVLSAGR